MYTGSAKKSCWRSAEADQQQALRRSAEQTEPTMYPQIWRCVLRQVRRNCDGIKWIRHKMGVSEKAGCDVFCPSFGWADADHFSWRDRSKPLSMNNSRFALFGVSIGCKSSLAHLLYPMATFLPCQVFRSRRNIG